MEEIRLYHSVWKTLLLAIFCLAFSVSFVVLFLLGEEFRWSDYDVIALVGFGVFIFIGLYGIYFLFVLLKERLWHQPYMTITDKSIIVNSIKKHEINIADVDCFDVVSFSMGNVRLFIYYKPTAERPKKKTNIDVSFIEVKASVLYDLLNERIPQQSSPIVQEELEELKNKTICDDETCQLDSEEPIDTVVRPSTKYQAMLYVFLSSVLIAAVWALVRWGWIEWGWLPKAKNYVPNFVVPALLTAIHLFICRNYIRAFGSIVGEYAWLFIAILPCLLFMGTGRWVKQKMQSIPMIHVITAKMEPVLAEADYIYVENLSIAEIDTVRGYYYPDFSVQHFNNRSDIIFHLYGVYPLRVLPNVFIASETTKRHDYTHASDEVLDEKFDQFMEKEDGFLLKEEMNHRYLKRLLPSDNIEGYQAAIKEIYKIEDKTFDSDKIVIYELQSEEVSTEDSGYFRNICLILLLLEALLLLFVYALFFKKDKYEEAVISSRRWERTVIHATPDEILLYSLPVLMIVVFLLMMFTGYSMDTANWEMLMQWGALEKESVLEEHEWWRLLTFGFLHDGFLHLFGNLFFYIISALFLLGRHSGYRITLVFLISTLVSGIFILLFSTGFCVGASGGVFGLMSFWVGYELYLKYVVKDPLASWRFVAYPVGMLVLNILLSFGNGISMSGHVGGLVAGLIMAVIIGAMNKKSEATAENFN